jgi:hypothetical protein
MRRGCFNWILSEFDRQKDFARQRGLEFSDAFIIYIVVEMGKTSVDIQLKDGKRRRRCRGREAERVPGHASRVLVLGSGKW